jgi:hypothetical protein
MALKPTLAKNERTLSKLDFIHLVIEPRQLPPSAVIYGKSFWRSGRNGDMQKHSLIENQGLIS